MRCPRCPDTELSTHTTLGGVEADVCPSCKGLWLDGHELGALLGVRDGRLENRPARDSEVACPRCDLQWLKTLRFPGSPALDVDRCPDCRGMWLDHGELGALRGRLAMSSVETAAPTHPLDEDLDAEPVSLAWLGLGWAFSLFVAVAPLYLIRHAFPDYGSVWWHYPILLVCYVTLAALVTPSFDRQAFFSRNRIGVDDGDFARAAGYLALLLIPGKLVAWTLVQSWHRARGD